MPSKLNKVYILEPNGQTNTAKYVRNIVFEGLKVFTSRGSIYSPDVEIPIFGGYGLGSNTMTKLFHYVRGLCLVLMSIEKNSTLHYHWLKFSPIDILFLRILKLKRIKLVGTVHNILPHEQKVWDEFFYRGIYSLTDVLVFHSAGIYEKFKQSFLKSKTHVIIKHYFDKVAIDREKEDPQHLLFFGNIRPYKGLELLLRAISQIPPNLDWKLTIAGKPEYNIDEIVNAVKGNLRITWITRFVSNVEVARLFNSCGVIVMPYLKIDTSGLLYLAKSYGKVIVAPNMGIFQEEILNNKNGILFTPLDENDLALAIERALNPSVFCDVSSVIRDEMPVDSIAEFKKKHENLYRSLL